MFLVSSRKYGCRFVIMTQDYKSANKLIVCSMNYMVLFKITDNISIGNITRNHNLDDIDKDLFKKVYHVCVKEPMDFMLLDFRTKEPAHKTRHNFLDFIDLRPKPNRRIINE